MRPVQVIGHAPTEAIELDARAHHIAVRQIGVEVHGEVFGFEHLKLQGDGEAILLAARAQADQAFAAFQHRAAGQGL